MGALGKILFLAPSTKHRENHAETDLYVSPTLACFEETKPHILSRDFRFNGITYRRLDAQYFAWLLHTLERAAQAVSEGHANIKQQDIGQGLESLAAIYTWCIKRTPQATFREEMANFDPSRYQAPRKDK